MILGSRKVRTVWEVRRRLLWIAWIYWSSNKLRGMEEHEGKVRGIAEVRWETEQVREVRTMAFPAVNFANEENCLLSRVVSL